MVEAENHPHRRRLARPVRPEEAGDPARPHGEGKPVDRERGAESLAETFYLDHRVPSLRVDSIIGGGAVGDHPWKPWRAPDPTLICASIHSGRVHVVKRAQGAH